MRDADSGVRDKGLSLMPKLRLGSKKRRARAPSMPSVAPVVAGPAPQIIYQSEPVRAADLTVGDYANGIPNIKLGSVFGSFMRQMLWLIPLLAIGWAAAWVLTADFKRTYSGEGTIMVQVGDEYVYQPVAGTTAQTSLMQTPDTITLNEVAIIKNPDVIDMVLSDIAASPGGLRKFSKRIAEKMAGHAEGSMGHQLAYMELRKKMDTSFHVSARPKSSIIDMSFKHEDPALAVSTLNALMAAYMEYRRTLFIDGEGDLISKRRADTEAKLNAIESRIAAFRAKNNVTDFDSERLGATQRTEGLRTSLNTLRADIVQAERSLASVEDQLRQTPATIDLYVDDRASNRIAQAELELQQLLAKYLPNSDPVQQKRLEIEQLRSLQQGQGGRATGGRRVGPNPTHQALMLQRNTLQSQADSFRDREAVIQRQLNEADTKLRQMNRLSPAYNDLLREQETLNARLRVFLTQEQEAMIDQQQLETASENVKVISMATYPIKGRNMRLLAFAFAALGWAFTLFMLALFRVFADPRLYAAPSQPRDLAKSSASPVSRDRHAEEPAPVQAVPYQRPDAYQNAPYLPAAYQAAHGAVHAAPQPYPPAQAWDGSQQYVDISGQVHAAPQHAAHDPGNPYLSGNVSASGFDR